MVARTRTTMTDAPSCTATAAAPTSTTSAAAFSAARGQNKFGHYGFDGVSQPLASTPSMQFPARPSAARGWVAKLYPSDFMPKSPVGKVLLLPLGLLMLAGSAAKAAVLMMMEVRPMTTDELFDRTTADPNNPISPWFNE